MQKNLLLPLIVFSCLTLSPLSCLLSPAFAASPTPTPTPLSGVNGSLSEPTTAPTINEVTENIKKRVQDAIGNEASEEEQNTLRGYIGVVQDVIKETVIVTDKDGKKKVQVTQDTTILRSPGNAAIKLTDIRIDDYIIAIGDQADTDEITGQRLIVSTAPITQNTKITGIGTIEKITKSTITLATKDDSIDLVTTTKTVTKSTMSSVLELSELAVGDTIIYTGTESTTSKTATGIMRIKTTSATQSEVSEPEDES